MPAHDLAACLARPADFADGDETGKAEWWILGDFGDGGHTWLGRYSGSGPWTRHPCDVVMHTLEGSSDVEQLVDGSTAREALPAGSVLSVPANTWYRVHAAEPVVQWGVTPGAIEHHQGDGLPS